MSIVEPVKIFVHSESPKKSSTFGKIQPSFGKPTEMDPHERVRDWELNISFHKLVNVQTTGQYFFYQSEIRNIKPRRKKEQLHREFSPEYHIPKGGELSFSTPQRLYVRERLKMSYNTLEDYQFILTMWKIQNFTFNVNFAQARLTLGNALNGGIQRSIMVRRVLPGKGNKKKILDVGRIEVSIELSELFEFELKLDNWTFKPFQCLGVQASHQKSLVFSVPKARSGRMKIKRTNYTDCYWRDIPGPFRFIGTKANLCSCFLKIKVKSWDKESLAGRARIPQSIGKAVFPLQSIMEMSVFKGYVKRLNITTSTCLEIVGQLMGHIKVVSKSLSVPRNIIDTVQKRPEQPLTGQLLSQLDYKDQYLVVQIFKADNLPTSGKDTANPFLKVKWDGMLFSSENRYIQRTIRPVFNECFYFPVRLVHDTIMRNSKLRKVALPKELESKGLLWIELWDFDEAGSDYLGAVRLDLNTLSVSPIVEKRSLLSISNKDRTEKKDEELEDFGLSTMKKDKFAVEYETRVAKISAELRGASSNLQVTGKCNVVFECFFWPDMPPECIISGQQEEDPQSSSLKEFEAEWNSFFEAEMKTYDALYPQAYPSSFDRTFCCVAQHPQERSKVPLSAFLSSIVLPEELTDPYQMLHWLKCLTFKSLKRQRQTGIVEEWSNPSQVLDAGKGTVQDHAVLLCSMLIGVNQDAFVCKGRATDEESCRSVDTVWVMTRESDGCVLFWDVVNRCRFKLLGRWAGKGKTKAKNQMEIQTVPKQSRTIDSSEEVPHVLHESDHRITEEEECYLPQLPSVFMKTDTVKPNVGRETRAQAIQKTLKKRCEDNRSPVVFYEKLSDLIPYDSIEIIFNHKNIWGNICNHHPSCILYDIENINYWKCFVNEYIYINPIDNDVIIGERPYVLYCERRSNEILLEICQDILLRRNKQGKETNIMSQNTEMLPKILEELLQLLEDRLNLDPGLDPGGVVDLGPSTDVASREMAERWQNYYERENKIKLSLGNADLYRRNHRFVGFPIRFSTADVANMKETLSTVPKYAKLIQEASDDSVFVISCKAFPLHSKLLSVWMFFGLQSPLISNLAQIKYSLGTFVNP
eukprot:GHVL01013916.1.p1 GENE.GHVL01013916.1~~GHVL01013916.1.p1  ORF type:complete len:1104 (+),score=195.31 GHVL01013916.1:36-3314(+)